MGIEPFLFLAVFVGGFVLQAGLAVREAVRRRLKARRWMRTLVSRTAQQLGWRGTAGGWAGAFHGLEVRITQASRRRSLRVIEDWTGVRPGMARRLDADTRLIVGFTLPEGLPRFTATAMGVADTMAHPLGDVVLDQLVRIDAADTDAVRPLLARPEVREPLLELLGRHPLSVVTDREVVVWLSGTVLDLTPTLELAREVATALARPSSAERPQVPLKARRDPTTTWA